MLVLASALVVLAGLVAVAVATSTSNPAPAATSAASVGLAAESSALYCGGLEHVAGELTSDVAVADLATESRVLELTVANELGQVAQRMVRVQPGTVRHLDPNALLRGSVLAMSIVASGGGVAATEALRGPDGAAVAPCVARAATSWWLTGGTTARHHTTVLTVYNPFASTAVFSVSLETPSGASVPPRLQGVVLGPHQLAAINLHAVAPNQAPITTIVHATDGTVVAYAATSSSQGTPSLSLLAGTSSPQRELTFPVGSSAKGRITTLVLATPAPAGADATVRILAPPGCTTHCPAAFDVSIPAGGTTTLTVSPSTRVPLGARMALIVTTADLGIVATQRISTKASVGQAAALDDPTASGPQTLVLINPLASGLDDLGLVNPSTTGVHVTLETVGRSGPHEIGIPYVVGPEQNLVLPTGALAGMVDGVLLIVADGPLRATGDVRGAVVGSGALVAVPTR
jgi:hypothetical protein